MQTYTKRNRHGDIGEHLVAFRIMRELGWPCRLFDIDLGVDAEVEILDDQSRSTGDVIKIQVKSVENAPMDSPLTVYVDEEHITYWRRFSTPLIFCGVDLTTEQVFWRQITALDSYETDGLSKKVVLDRVSDELGPHTKRLWKNFMSPNAAHDLATHVAAYEALAATVEHDAGDFETIARYEKTFTELHVLEDKITQLIAHIPWKITGVQLATFEHRKRSVQIRENNTGRLRNDLIEGG